MSQIPERLLPAFSVVIYPPGYQPPHFFLSKNPVVRFIDGPAKPFARALHQLDEVSVLELHAASSPIGGKIHKPNGRFLPKAATPEVNPAPHKRLPRGPRNRKRIGANSIRHAASSRA